MRKRIMMIFALAAIMINICAFSAVAQAPNTIMYQGKLTNSSGTPITSATSVIFSIYAAASGGSALWTETISITPDAQGVFTQELGLSTALPANLFNGAKRYLGIQVGTDTEMTPRQVLVSGPYSISATNIPDNSVNSAKVVNGSLSNVDILDEPGVAQAKSAGASVTVANTGITPIVSRQITTPGAGYVVATGLGYASLGSSSGTTLGNVIVGIDTLNTTYGTDYSVFGASSVTVASNIYWWGSVANSRIFYFPSAVTKTFYMNAGRGYADGIAYIYLPKIQLIFYPSSYGTVTSTVAANEGSQFDQAAPVSIGGAASGESGPVREYRNVDLRELELKVTKAQAAAEKAESELYQAKLKLQMDAGKNANANKQEN